jgi:tetratricopeptide (TPR) repeat protein
LAVRKLYDQAVTQYNAGNQAESLRLFEECVAADSTYTEAYLNISYITFDQNNFVKALSECKKGFEVQSISGANLYSNWQMFLSSGRV